MHLFQGAIYGLSPATDATRQFPHRTPIGGLFQAGQASYPMPPAKDAQRLRLNAAYASA